MCLATQCPISPKDPLSDALIASLSGCLLLSLYHHAGWAGALTTLLLSLCGSGVLLLLSSRKPNR